MSQLNAIAAIPRTISATDCYTARRRQRIEPFISRMRSFCIEESTRPRPRPATSGASWFLSSEEGLRQALGLNSVSCGVLKQVSPLMRPSVKGEFLWTVVVPNAA
eukprot:4185620-Pyramimonas_sp.AAC.1